MADGDRRVCPRCGSDAGQDEYCQTCGLHLLDQKELPTRDGWNAMQATASAQGSVVDRARALAGRAGDWFMGLDPLRRVVAGIAGAVAVAGIALGASQLGADSDDLPSGPYKGPRFGPGAGATGQQGPLPEQRCVDSWNSANTNRGKSIFENKEAYAAVGFSVDFPDQCLVTIAVPEYGVGGVGFQLQETRPGEWRGLGGGGLETFPASAKQWNATRLPSGELVIGPP